MTTTTWITAPHSLGQFPKMPFMNEGQKVEVYFPNGNCDTLIGTATIIRKVSDTTFEVRHSNGVTDFRHIDCLVPIS